MSKEISYSRRLAAASGLCLAVAAIAALGAEHKSDGIYLGKRVLIKGSDPYCPAEDDVSIIIHGETLLFTDSALQKCFILVRTDRLAKFLLVSEVRLWRFMVV